MSGGVRDTMVMARFVAGQRWTCSQPLTRKQAERLAEAAKTMPHFEIRVVPSLGARRTQTQLDRMMLRRA